MSYLALTNYGRRWVCRGRDVRRIHLSKLPGGLGFIKGKLHTGVIMHSFCKSDFFWRTPFSTFGCSETFSKDPMHRFINEQPGQWPYVPEELCSPLTWGNWDKKSMIQHLPGLLVPPICPFLVHIVNSWQYGAASKALIWKPMTDIARGLSSSFHTVYKKTFYGLDCVKSLTLPLILGQLVISGSL